MILWEILKIIPNNHQFGYFTMRHKFSNFHLIFKMQNGMKMKVNKIFNPLIFNALAIIMPNFHWNKAGHVICMISSTSRGKRWT